MPLTANGATLRPWLPNFSLRFPEDKKTSRGYESEADDVVPPEFFTQISDGKNGEYDQSDHFLDRLQLRRRKLIRTDAVCGHLKAVFEQGDAPAYEYSGPERRLPESQVAVPRKRHEHIGYCQKDYCSQAVILPPENMTGRQIRISKFEFAFCCYDR
jgi:hypothetical protein